MNPNAELIDAGSMVDDTYLVANFFTIIEPESFVNSVLKIGIEESIQIFLFLKSKNFIKSDHLINKALEINNDDLKDIGTLFGVNDPDAKNFIMKTVLDTEIFYPFRILFERSLIFNPFYKSETVVSPGEGDLIQSPQLIYSPISSLQIQILLY